jgi:hypothetical protein
MDGFTLKTAFTHSDLAQNRLSPALFLVSPLN